MNSNRRFVLDEERRIIDTLNYAHGPVASLPEGEPDDEKFLRETVFIARLPALIHKLFPRTEPARADWLGNAHEIFVALIPVIEASQLSALNPGLSIQHGRSDKPVRSKQSICDFTSLELFADDVELLLRDLYTDGDIVALDRVRSAVLKVTFALTKHLRKDLWQEHLDAMELDWFYASPNSAISDSDFECAMVARASLMSRVHEVDADPSAFGEYTIEFAKHLGERWDCRSDLQFIRLWARPSQGTSPKASGWSDTLELLSEALLTKGT
jgi:hypothetical protein